MIYILKKLIDENTVLGRNVALFIQALIIISVITFTLDTLPDLSRKDKNILKIIETVIVIIFTIEYLLRLFLSNERKTYIFSFYGLVDLLAILPFYLSVGLDLRSLRLVRIFRLLRLLKITRYNSALSHLLNAFQIAKIELLIVLCISIILIYFASVGIYYFEYEAQPENFKSVLHSMWWAVATLTTVGYGDIYPITIGGRIFTFIILMIGLSLVALPAGVLLDALQQSRKDRENEHKSS